MASIVVFAAGFAAGCLTGGIVCLRLRHRRRRGTAHARDAELA